MRKIKYSFNNSTLATLRFDRYWRWFLSLHKGTTNVFCHTLGANAVFLIKCHVDTWIKCARSVGKEECNKVHIFRKATVVVLLIVGCQKVRHMVRQPAQRKANNNRHEHFQSSSFASGMNYFVFTTEISWMLSLLDCIDQPTVQRCHSH